MKLVNDFILDIAVDLVEDKVDRVLDAYVDTNCGRYGDKAFDMPWAIVWNLVRSRAYWEVHEMVVYETR